MYGLYKSFCGHKILFQTNSFSILFGCPSTRVIILATLELYLPFHLSFFSKTNKSVVSLQEVLFFRYNLIAKDRWDTPSAKISKRMFFSRGKSH